MLTIHNEQVYCFDVDDTLVMWDDQYADRALGRVRIVDPYDGATVYLKPHARHIKLLKQMHGRGRQIIVWSQGGAAWARAVIEALGLSEYVHICMTKPAGYVDDLPAQAWLPNRIYLSHQEEPKHE